ncbi:MAG: NAD(P)-dependent oxidoreductase [Armatimonadetes bacterium]|nr:NAD(P)-dependent oxidoreductase [Armatimonadota bacterium]MDW8122161.1 NAD(P)-dependent oxidoreductase [Armatimonadota bacterium]
MKVLITGGSGFLGLHMGRRLLLDQHQVVLLDIAEMDINEYEEVGPPLPGQWRNCVTFVKGDVRDPAAVASAMKGADAVIHSAAALPLWRPNDILTTNILGTQVVLETAKKLGIKRVIFISSTSVYGIPQKHPIYEDDPLDGVGLYGISKIAAEEVCQQFRNHGLTVPILRPKTFVGPGRLGVFQILFDWIDRGKPIPMIGSGANRYQLLDVEDLTEVVSLFLTAPENEVNDTFNIGAERFGTVREDLTALCQHAKTGAQPVATPARLSQAMLQVLEALKLSPLYKWVYLTADKDSFVAIDKVKRRLQWAPKFSNADALIRTYDWYRAHQDRLDQQGGVTHRAAWSQGALRVLRDLLPSRKGQGKER